MILYRSPNGSYKLLLIIYLYIYIPPYNYARPIYVLCSVNVYPILRSSHLLQWDYFQVANYSISTGNFRLYNLINNFILFYKSDWLLGSIFWNTDRFTPNVGHLFLSIYIIILSTYLVFTMVYSKYKVFKLRKYYDI